MPLHEIYSGNLSHSEKESILEEAFHLGDVPLLLAPFDESDEAFFDLAFQHIGRLELEDADIENIDISIGEWDDTVIVRMINVLSGYLHLKSARDVVDSFLTAPGASKEIIEAAKSAISIAPEEEEAEEEDDDSEEEGMLPSWLTGKLTGKKQGSQRGGVLARKPKWAKKKKQEIIYKQGNEPTNILNPEVVIPIDVYAQIVELCHRSGQNEVGWFGTMTVSKDRVLIDEIFLPTQRVSPVTVDISGLPEIAANLAQEGRMDDVARLHFWGHCHPGGGPPGPSGQDEREWRELIADSPIILMGIFSCDANNAYWRLYYHGLILRLGWRVICQKPDGPFFEDFDSKVR